MEVLVRPAAAADIEDAYRWYEEQRQDLGNEFIEELNRTIASIREYPSRFAVVRRGTRRALLHRFPYGLFYSVRGETILVVACMHARQNPRQWHSRP